MSPVSIRRLRPSLRHVLVEILSLVCLALFSPAVSAQPTGTLTGVIRDVSSGAIADASVEIVVADRVIAATTSAVDGRYRLELPSGVPFSLHVRRTGFAAQSVAFSGRSGDIAFDVTLAIGSVSDTLVVSASRAPEDRAKVTQSVTVATRAEIEALGATELSDVLRIVPGVTVAGTGREGGGPTSLFARGGDSDYNVVLIDGVRANLDGGRFDFSRIAAGEIERVEIVRGAQSSLWGADAMSSVVQVFTKRAAATDAVQFSAAAEGGSFNTFRGNTGVNGGAGGRVDYRAGVTRRSTDGAFNDLLPEDDAYEQTAFDGGGGTALGTRATVRAGVRYSKADGHSVGPVNYGSRDSGGAYDTKDLSAHTTVTHAIGSRFTGTGTFNYFRYEGVSADRVVDPPYSTFAILAGTPNALFPNGTRLVRLIDQAEFNRLVATGAMPAPGQFLASRVSNDSTFNSLTEFRRPAARYLGDFTWGSGQRFSVGYDWERETNPNVAGFDLDNNGFFLQQQITIADRWFATVGVRVDSKESYSTFVSPKLSAGGFLVPARRGALSSVKLFGNIGRGVKSPTFTERFGGAGFADPNPDIQVELARSGDIGLETTFSDQRFRTSATYFNNHFTDQISFRPGQAGDGIPEYINIDGSKATGWEVELAVQKPVRGVTAVATYALVDTAVVTNQSTSQQFQPGQPLLRRPKHSGTVRGMYVLGPASVNVNVRLVGQRFDNSFLSLRTMANSERPTATTTDITVNPGYVVAGLGFDYLLHDSLTLFIRGDNIGGEEYESVLGYPGLPRSFVVGARWRVGGRQ
jgi:outer membrane cobalamin receptor